MSLPPDELPSMLPFWIVSYDRPLHRLQILTKVLDNTVLKKCSTRSRINIVRTDDTTKSYVQSKNPNRICIITITLRKKKFEFYFCWRQILKNRARSRNKSRVSQKGAPIFCTRFKVDVFSFRHDWDLARLFMLLQKILYTLKHHLLSLCSLLQYY